MTEDEQQAVEEEAAHEWWDSLSSDRQGVLRDRARKAADKAERDVYFLAYTADLFNGHHEAGLLDFSVDEDGNLVPTLTDEGIQWLGELNEDDQQG